MIENNDANITINHVNDNLENMELDRVKKGSTEVDVMVMGGGGGRNITLWGITENEGRPNKFSIIGRGSSRKGEWYS